MGYAEYAYDSKFEIIEPPVDGNQDSDFVDVYDYNSMAA